MAKRSRMGRTGCPIRARWRVAGARRARAGRSFDPGPGRGANERRAAPLLGRARRGAGRPGGRRPPRSPYREVRMPPPPRTRATRALRHRHRLPAALLAAIALLLIAATPGVAATGEYI